MNEVSYISVIATMCDKFPSFEWESSWDLRQDYPVILKTTLQTEDFNVDYGYCEGFYITIIIKSYLTTIEVYYKSYKPKGKQTIKEFNGNKTEEVISRLEFWVNRVAKKFNKNE